MKFDFTPGPWSFRDGFGWWDFHLSYLHNKNTLFMKKKTGIAIGNMPRKEDVRLMAYAPEMLKGLIELVISECNSDFCCGNDCNDCNDCKNCNNYEKIQLIEKATGKKWEDIINE